MQHVNIFVTGTDTDVGKTVISAWICIHSLARYWKPMQTGADSDSSTVKQLSSHTEILPEAYKFHAPLSVYDASKMANKTVDISTLKCRCDNIIIEGAGGILVPIAKKFLMIDVVKQNDAKALIVAKSKLGMINHILLTVEILNARNIDIIGIVINGNIDQYIKETIEYFSGEKIIAVIPELNNLKFGLENIPLPKEILEVIK